MQTKATILVKTQPQQTKNAFRSLQELPGIKSFTPVVGRFDVLLTVETPDNKALNDFVVNKIRPVEGVRDTETLIWTE